MAKHVLSITAHAHRIGSWFSMYTQNNGVQRGLIVKLRSKFCENRYLFEGDMAKYVLSFTAHAHRIGGWFAMYIKKQWGSMRVTIVDLRSKLKKKSVHI